LYELPTVSCRLATPPPPQRTTQMPVRPSVRPASFEHAALSLAGAVIEALTVGRSVCQVQLRERETAAVGRPTGVDDDGKEMSLEGRADRASSPTCLGIAAAAASSARPLDSL